MVAWFTLLATSLLLGGQVQAAHRRAMSSPTPSFFETSWILPTNITLLQPANISYAFTEDIDEHMYGRQSLVLCQTNATGATPLDSSNTWTVVQISDCSDSGVAGTICSFNTTTEQTTLVTFASTSSTGNVPNLSNFFFCFGTAPGAIISDLSCESYSPYFDIRGSDLGLDISVGPGSGSNAPIATPTTPLLLPQNTPVLHALGAQLPAPSTFPLSSSIISTSYATVTLGPTATPTASPSSGAAFSSVQSEPKGGLSIGAKAGIAVSAVAVVVIALLAFFLHGKRRPKRQSEDVMLTLNPYTESRDLITEKDLPAASVESVLESTPSRAPFTPNPRHSYDTLGASQPYSGRAAAIPRRKPTPSSLGVRTSMLSRELSDASGHISPRSIVRGGDGDEFEEPYHDEPVFGDTRHVPRVYESMVRAPFLSEPGMTEEEISRLEDEERRIDEAIAEAEGR